MLTFVMSTGDEGPDLDLALRALAKAMRGRDALLVFHGGDGHTLTQLQDFAKHHATRIIQTDQPVDRFGDLLQLGLKEAGTEYTCILAPTDRPQQDAVATLHAHLEQGAPDLCLVQNASWLADADHPLPRSDNAAFAALTQSPDAAACAGLLPDPRRLIFRTADWAGRAALWPTGLDGKGLYDRAMSESTDLTALKVSALLHRLAPVDPGPVLSDCAAALAACPKGERAATLADWRALLDEHITLCPPAEATTLLNALPPIVALLPRSARRNVTQASGGAEGSGPFARLLAAQIKDGALGAKAELGLLLAAQQQHRSDVLAAAYGRLRQDLDIALPGPDYLRALYTRLRDL